MEEIAETYRAQGYHPYIIPMGASNGIGTFGYIHCMEEILAQEQAMGLNFDTLVDAVGSGGTYAGLYAGAQPLSAGKRIVGFNVCGHGGDNSARRLPRSCGKRRGTSIARPLTRRGSRSSTAMSAAAMP